VGEQGDNFDKEQCKEVRLEKRKVTPEAKAKARDLAVKKIHGSDVSRSHDPCEGVKEKLNAYVLSIQKGFEGQVIKRNEGSVRFDGKLLTEMVPPFTQIPATCHLTDKEKKILEDELIVIAEKWGFASFSHDLFTVLTRVT
jgi:hypothetical protein